MAMIGQPGGTVRRPRLPVTDPDKLRGRTRHNKVVNFSGFASPGELGDVEIHSATSQTLAGEESLAARATR